MSSTVWHVLTLNGTDQKITSEDNRAKVVVENARIEGSFDTFRLRINYENTLL